MNSPVRIVFHFVTLCVSAACSGTDAPPGNASTNVASVGGSQAAGGLTGTIGVRGSAIGTGGKTSSVGVGSRGGSDGGTGLGRAAISGGARGIGESADTASATGASTTGDATISGGKIGAGGLGSTSSVPAPGGNGGVGHTTMTTAKPVAVGVATKVTDGSASGGYVVGLTSTGQGAQVTGLPAASKLAIRYASVSVGTISVSLNGQTARKINVHSSGALTGSFIYAIIDIAIPANATATITRATGDVAVSVDHIIVGNGSLGLPPDIWNLPTLPLASGLYAADWKTLGLAYTVPDWWREAKFGAWSHWDPQSMPEQGDWYSRKMYIEGDAVYTYHSNTYGHPSTYGYKDLCENWVIDRWQPDELMGLYVEMGAHFFMAMGVHHDNFDCWDSTYQPWNSVRVGPKTDIVGTWEKSARRHGLRFGIGFHNSPARTWGQFMTVRYTSDKRGARIGVDYDALQTILDGKGKWWDGMDPVDLYGPKHAIDDSVRSPFANQFMWRVDDAITKYHPDVLYFDEHAGDSQTDLGVRMGLSFLAPTLIANYYNKSMTWNQGKMDVVINLKGVGGTYNSFQNSPDLLPYVERALVRSTEAQIEPQISAYPFQTETSIQDWHYRTGQGYTDARTLVQQLMQNVSRNGTMLLNLTQRGRGDLDSALVSIAKDVGAWLKINGEAVYGSRPFEVMGDNTVAYTRNKGNVYATLFGWNGGAITLKALASEGATLGTVTKVELLGSTVALTFAQNAQGLTVTPSGSVQALPTIANRQLASGTRVLRITHDKNWVNDDDPGAMAPGWLRKCNLGTRDYNNDLTTSSSIGRTWTSTFDGTQVRVYAPREAGSGTLEIQVDGQSRATADLSTAGARLPQQLVAEVTGLTAGQHTLNLVNRGPGPVAVDAIQVK
ncbi:MAG: alpha-L-fucosidase [Myxococcales bacterium]